MCILTDQNSDSVLKLVEVLLYSFSISGVLQCCSVTAVYSSHCADNETETVLDTIPYCHSWTALQQKLRSVYTIDLYIYLQALVGVCLCSIFDGMSLI